MPYISYRKKNEGKYKTENIRQKIFKNNLNHSGPLCIVSSIRYHIYYPPLLALHINTLKTICTRLTDYVLCSPGTNLHFLITAFLQGTFSHYGNS